MQREQPNFRREFRLLGSKVARGADESSRLDREVPRTEQRDIEEPCVLRRRKPFAALAPRFDQIEQRLAPVPVWISLDCLTID